MRSESKGVYSSARSVASGRYREGREERSYKQTEEITDST